MILIEKWKPDTFSRKKVRENAESLKNHKKSQKLAFKNA
jgi:hypothetical protein